MNVICPVVNRGPSIQCPCFDDPVANLSAEEPDVDVFIPNPPGPRPPDPKVYIGYGCAEWIFCASTISQEAADDCANQYDILCLEPPDVDPPIPPGPNGPTGPGTPGGIVPPSPRNPLPKYYNTEQSCTSECPNGQVFSSTVAAGTVVDLTSVSNANAKAAALACNRANKQKLCFANSPPGGCLGEPYEFDFEVVGNELADGGYFWTSFDLPPGLELNAFTGQVTGTPTVPGSYFVLVDVFGGNNSFNTNSFTICIMEIENASVLTDATIDETYLEPLTQFPATVSSEVWTIVTGTLPPGITLQSNGALTGTPTELGTFEFTLRCAATCDGQSVVCTKSFVLDVVEGCLAQEIFDLVWVPVVSAIHCSPLVSDGGNMTFACTPVPNGPFDNTWLDISTTLTNPNAFACNIDILFDYSQFAPAQVGPTFPTTMPFIVLNADPTIVAVAGADGCCPDSQLQPVPGGQFQTNGAVVWLRTISIPPGANTLRLSIFMNSEPGTGGTMNGSIIIESGGPT